MNQESNDKYTEYEAKLEADASDPCFLEFAKLLYSDGHSARAIEVCMAGLSANPLQHEARLYLARVCFERKLYPYAIREVEELQKELPKNQQIQKLLEKLRPGSSESSEDSDTSGESAATEETVAETDFDLDDFEDWDS